MRVESMDAAITPTVNFTSNVEANNELLTRQKPAVRDEGTNDQDKFSDAFVERAVNKANDTMRFHGRSLKFEIHEKTNDIMVKIIDKETQEVIREIPPEKMLDMFASMLELAGLLVDERT